MIYETDDSQKQFDENILLIGYEAHAVTPDEDTFFIKEIKDHWIRNGWKEFHIKSQSFPIEKQTWEPDANIFNHPLTETYFFNKQKLFISEY